MKAKIWVNVHHLLCVMCHKESFVTSFIFNQKQTCGASRCGGGSVINDYFVSLSWIFVCPQMWSNYMMALKGSEDLKAAEEPTARTWSVQLYRTQKKILSFWYCNSHSDGSVFFLNISKSNCKNSTAGYYCFVLLELHWGEAWPCPPTFPLKTNWCETEKGQQSLSRTSLDKLHLNMIW